MRPVKLQNKVKKVTFFALFCISYKTVPKGIFENHNLAHRIINCLTLCTRWKKNLLCHRFAQFRCWPEGQAFPEEAEEAETRPLGLQCVHGKVGSGTGRSGEKKSP